VRTIVDCTTFDLGRDALLLADVSRASGGRDHRGDWHLARPAGHYPFPHGRSAGLRFTADLTEGMDGTGIRAGVIKVASHERVEPFEAVILAAAAKASSQTGAPINHAHGGGVPDWRGAGADPGRVRHRPVPGGDQAQ
jgi:phosphotriesterase-related protein